MLFFLFLCSFGAVAVEISPTEGVADAADQHRADAHAGRGPECLGHQFVQLPFLQIELQRTLTADDALVDALDVPTPRAIFPSTAADDLAPVVLVPLTRHESVMAGRVEDDLAGIFADVIVPGSAFAHKPMKEAVAFPGIRGEVVAGRGGMEGEAKDGKYEERAAFHKTAAMLEAPDTILNASLLSRLEVVLQVMVDRSSEGTPEVRANLSNAVLITMVGIFVFMVVGAVVFVI